MPIDTKTPYEPGWWMVRLEKELKVQRDRYELLDRYFRGEPPLPSGAEQAHRAYAAFQKKARLNLARLIVQAVRQRLTPTGFRTAAAGDENGDKQAWEVWKEAGLTVAFSDVARAMLTGSVGYAIVQLDPDTNDPIVTAEDPRQVITAHDPLTGKVVAALKLFHDPVQGKDFAYCYLPGELWVASRPVRRALSSNTTVKISPSTWDWDEDLTVDLPDGLEDVVPVLCVRNEDDMGEFEPHLADLDRINHMILQRMVIATMQAFRQRAIKGDLPTHYPKNHPLEGQEIDYEGIFVADPGALWMIPGAAEIWESGVTDITPILSAVKDDIRGLSAASQTPLHMFHPEGENQAAAGTKAASDDFVFKVDDRRDRADLFLTDLLAMLFKMLGDDERAVRKAIEVIWAPAERLSLAERADAAAKAKGTLPLRAMLTEIWQFTPQLVDRYEKELRREAEDDPALRAARELSDLGA